LVLEGLWLILKRCRPFPREIDELIYQHPKVEEGITIGLPDPHKGERIKVYIVLREGEVDPLLQRAAHPWRASQIPKLDRPFGLFFNGSRLCASTTP